MCEVCVCTHTYAKHVINCVWHSLCYHIDNITPSCNSLLIMTYQHPLWEGCRPFILCYFVISTDSIWVTYWNMGKIFLYFGRQLIQLLMKVELKSTEAFWSNMSFNLLSFLLLRQHIIYVSMLYWGYINVKIVLNFYTGVGIVICFTCVNVCKFIVCVGDFLWMSTARKRE